MAAQRRDGERRRAAANDDAVHNLRRPYARGVRTVAQQKLHDCRSAVCGSRDQRRPTDAASNCIHGGATIDEQADHSEAPRFGETRRGGDEQNWRIGKRRPRRHIVDSVRQLKQRSAIGRGGEQRRDSRGVPARDSVDNCTPAFVSVF